MPTRLILHLDDHVARREMLVGPSFAALGIDAGDDTPLTSSLTLYLLRMSSASRLDNSSPSVFCTTDFARGAASFLVVDRRNLFVVLEPADVTLGSLPCPCG